MTELAKKPAGRDGRKSSGKAAAKRALILGVAARLIAQRGFEDVTLEEICAAASCSKTAIYRFFGNKEGLLSALTNDIAVELSQTLHAFHLRDMSIEESLLRYARLALSLILNDRHIAVVRATIASAWKHDKIGPKYYEVGALTAQRALAQYFELHTKSGEVLVPDPQWAAHEFQGLLFWERMVAQLVGARQAPSEAEIEDQATKAVAAFLRRYRNTAHSQAAERSL
jgi:AcrR family transcriptional regulator